MYKLTFDDKPEANTYVKWARDKGYLVEGPYREKLAKSAKKFDLNGKPKKYSYVVMRKRGVGKEGGDVGYVPEKGKRKKKTRSVSQAKAEMRERMIAQGVFKRDVAQGTSPQGMSKKDLIHGMIKDIPRQIKRVEKILAAKEAAKAEASTKKAIHEKLMADVEGMKIGSRAPVEKTGQEKKIPERLVGDASKLLIGSRAPVEKKSSAGMIPAKWTQDWQEKQVRSEIEEYKKANPGKELLYHGGGRLEGGWLSGGYLTTNIDEAMEYASREARTGEPKEAFVYVVDKAKAHIGRSHIPNLPENVELLKSARYMKSFDIMKDYTAKPIKKPKPEAQAARKEIPIQPEISKKPVAEVQPPAEVKVRESIKKGERIPLKVLREHREVVKEEREERRKAKAEKGERESREKEWKEAEEKEAKYWEETKLTAEQQGREEEVEAMRKETESDEENKVD